MGLDICLYTLGDTWQQATHACSLAAVVKIVTAPVPHRKWRRLHDGSQRLFGKASGLEKTGKVAAFPELGDAQLNSARTGLPVALTGTVALGEPLVALLSIASTRQATHLKGHQPLRGKADHLAQKVSVCALSHKRLQVHHIVGHRWSALVGCCNPNLNEDR